MLSLLLELNREHFNFRTYIFYLLVLFAVVVIVSVIVSVALVYLLFTHKKN